MSAGRDGCSTADIARAAKRYGLEAADWRRDLRHLPKVALPAILFWEFNHFVVLEGLGKGRYCLNDPANGRRVVNEEAFSQAFTGIVLTLKPGPDFRRSGARPGAGRRLWPWLREVKRPLAFASLCGVLLAIPGLVLPVLLSVLVDEVLEGPQTDWGAALVAAAAAASALFFALTWLQQLCLHRLAVRLSVVQADRFLSHLLRLPMRYFAHRYAGDLTTRVQLVDNVASTGSVQFVGVVIELITSALFLALMFVLDPWLALAVAAIALACALITRTVTRMRTDEARQLSREQGQMSGIELFGVRNMDSLRATGGGNDFFARWSGYQARELAARQRFTELGHVTVALPGLFIILGGAAVLGLGGWRVVAGEMTVGMLMGFYVLAGNFLRPIGNFVRFADLFQTLEADMQRLEDVMRAPQDPEQPTAPKAAPGKIATLDGRLRLAGRIELRGVTFGYQRNHPPLIENFNLTIEPGQRVALVGTTGSGKSTLLALAAGIYTPWAGEVRFDGAPRREIPREILVGSVATVDQSVFLFSASVRDNLTL